MTTPMMYCNTCCKMTTNYIKSIGGGFMCRGCGGDVSTVETFYKQRDKDVRRAVAWRSFGEASIAEPITESLYFNEVINLLRDELENGSDNSNGILKYLRSGARDYLDQCRDLSEDDQCSGHESKIDLRQRAMDLKSELRNTTEAIYGHGG